MKKITIALLCISLFSCADDDYTPIVEKSIPNIDERIMAGGETTIFESGFFSFDNPAPNLTSPNFNAHMSGDAQFEQAFVTAPATVNSGLGAQFNHTSCIGCHPKDGRAAFPVDLNANTGFFLRVSIPGSGPHGGPNPAPGFGGQLAQNAVYGVQPEVQFQVSYSNYPVTFADGTVVNLQRPAYSVYNSYIPMPVGYMLSPRLAPPVYGLGLLEAITESDILLREDISDSDSDGISGKANYVWNPETMSMALGRFGWKGGAPTVMTQSAGAYNNDMGVTNPLFPVESSFGQTNGDNLNDDPEITQQILDDVALYCRTLAVPAARNLDNPQVIRGYELFEAGNCVACHTPKHITGSFSGIPGISNQTIYPYTDMLLHDMGPDLADGRSEFLANGNEWKTRPLWGIGLTSIVNGHTDFLHDGRAKNIEEAILWHGGEAEESKNYYTNLNEADRKALIAFVEAL